MYQKQVIVGRLTRDPESTTYGENTVCRFAVACDDGFGDKKTTDFFNVSAWGKMGASVQQYTKKGSVVLVEGKMKMSKKESVTYWELRADNVRFLDSKGDAQNNQQQFQQQGGQQFQQQPQQQYQQQFQQQPQQQYQQFQQNSYQQQPQQFQQFQQGGGMDFNISDDALPF